MDKHNTQEYPPATIPQVQAALKYIDPNMEREDWVKVGMAIKSEFESEDDDDALGLFDDWSQGGDSYKEEDTLSTWQSIDPEGGINIGKLFSMAKSGGWTYIAGKPEDVREKPIIHSELKPEDIHTGPDGEAYALYEIGTSIDIEHDYPANKKITPYKAKQHGSTLLIPMYFNDDLVSVQKISSTGDKRFMKGGRVKGAYLLLADPSSRIVVCEGYATGCSLQEKQPKATVVVAFSKSNLKAVALSMKAKYPDGSVDIMADNDGGTIPNPGILKAYEAAIAVGGKCYYPDFAGLNTSGGDFNDLVVSGHFTKTRIKTYVPRVYSNIPSGYVCTDDGVVQLTENDDIQITRKPVWATARSTDDQGSNSSILVHWLDSRENERTQAIAKRLMHSQGVEAALTLIENDLPVVKGKEHALIEYLSAFNPKQMMTSVTSSGWVREAFVLPYTVINPPAGEALIYQPHGSNNIADAIRTKGTLDSWKQGITSASPLVQFLVCAALSAPVRYKVGIEAGGFHIYTLTSHGKTTALQVAASVWGNGVDPAISGGSEAYIQKWNATSNSLEAKAEIFNDLPLIVDEIGEADPKDFGSTIYKIISGVGRGRANISGDMRDSKSWRILLLSAGEVAVSDFIESGGTPMKGGQGVRLADIDLSACDPLFKDGTEANNMKAHCAEYYGLAGPTFIEKIPDMLAGWEAFDHALIGGATTPIAERVRTRFALVAYTGLQAVSGDILPWTEKQIMDATKQAYEAWHTNMNVISDVDRGIQSVKDYILANESRFEVSGVNEYPTVNRAGWIRNDMYHFTTKAFKAACDGVDPTKIKRGLQSAGLLHVNKPAGLNSSIKVNQQTVSVVSVKVDILAE